MVAIVRRGVVDEFVFFRGAQDVGDFEGIDFVENPGPRGVPDGVSDAPIGQ